MNDKTRTRSKEELDSREKGFLEIESLGFYMFVDILGVVLSFFILASVWRAADKDKANIMWRNLSKISIM